MVENQMEQKAENRLEKLMHGRAAGMAVALRGCAAELAGSLQMRYGDAAPVPLRLYEPCRVEHPHSAFLRKSVERNGAKAVHTTLFAPGGKLTEQRDGDGRAIEYFVKKEKDFEILRGFLRDVELHPAKTAHGADSAAQIACLSLSPLRELETRWAGPELSRWALTSGDESAASCLRKLERQLHRRAEEAARAGCRACTLRDMAAEPLPETYMMHAGRHIEWLRHTGLATAVEVSEPTAPLLAALAAAGAGARMPLDLALGEDFPALPAGMRLLLDLDAAAPAPEPEPLRRLLDPCADAILILDCFQADEAAITAALDRLLGIF
jgi:hypothetical protein